MSKNNTCIYLLARFPVFNTELVPPFPGLDKMHSGLLHQALFMNFHYILEDIKDNVDFLYCIDENDRDFLPDKLKDQGNIMWYNSNDKTALFNRLDDKHFTSYSSNLLLTSDSMGVALKDIKKVFNLLAIDDDAIVLGKTDNNKVCFTGFNKLDDDFFPDFNFDDLNYIKALSAVCKQNAHLNVIDNFLVVENQDEFKKLYTELGKKESLAYCNQAMHEEFTHIFIEYKELLK